MPREDDDRLPDVPAERDQEIQKLRELCFRAYLLVREMPGTEEVMSLCKDLEETVKPITGTLFIDPDVPATTVAQFLDELTLQVRQHGGFLHYKILEQEDRT